MNLEDFLNICFYLIDETLPIATEGNRLRERGPMPKLATIVTPLAFLEPRH